MQVTNITCFENVPVFHTRILKKKNCPLKGWKSLLVFGIKHQLLRETEDELDKTSRLLRHGWIKYIYIWSLKYILNIYSTQAACITNTYTLNYPKMIKDDVTVG